MPRVWLWNVPAPKSGCRVTVAPMKLMMFAELASTCAVEMSVFHKLVDWNGTKPFRLAPCPRLIPLQVPDCENAIPQERTTTSGRIPEALCFVRIHFPFLSCQAAV